jgi:hypothetical protein
MPDQPWHKIRALGKILRHKYDPIAQDRLFDIVQTDLGRDASPGPRRGSAGSGRGFPDAMCCHDQVTWS